VIEYIVDKFVTEKNLIQVFDYLVSEGNCRILYEISGYINGKENSESKELNRWERTIENFLLLRVESLDLTDDFTKWIPSQFWHCVSLIYGNLSYSSEFRCRSLRVILKFVIRYSKTDTKTEKLSQFISTLPVINERDYFHIFYLVDELCLKLSSHYKFQADIKQSLTLPQTRGLPEKKLDDIILPVPEWLSFEELCDKLESWDVHLVSHNELITTHFLLISTSQELTIHQTLSKLTRLIKAYVKVKLQRPEVFIFDNDLKESYNHIMGIFLDQIELSVNGLREVCPCCLAPYIVCIQLLDNIENFVEICEKNKNTLHNLRLLKELPIIEEKLWHREEEEEEYLLYDYSDDNLPLEFGSSEEEYQ
jgi:hypothetical protein